MRETVWVIEEGSYSDYHVVGIYSKREDAERIAQKLTGSYEKPTVREWEMNTGLDALDRGLKRFHIIMLLNGDVERMAEGEWSSYNLETELIHWKRTTAPAYIGRGILDALRCGLWAKDEKHAIKIANEKRVQMLASGEIVDPGA